jgi:hypothetical protein
VIESFYPAIFSFFNVSPLSTLRQGKSLSSTTESDWSLKEFEIMSFANSREWVFSFCNVCPCFNKALTFTKSCKCKVSSKIRPSLLKETVRILQR